MRTHEEYQEALDKIVENCCPKRTNCKSCEISKRCNSLMKDEVDILQELIDSKKPKKIVKKYDTDKIHHKMFCPHCGNRWDNMIRSNCDCCGGPIDWEINNES